MIRFNVLDSSRKRVFFILLLALVVLLTLASALRYSVTLEGLTDTEPKRLDTGWFYEDGGSLHPLGQLPCELELESDRLYLVRSISEKDGGRNDVLTVETRYQSIRVWADEILIYEAAQGREHALSSMWHFIPWEKYSEASSLKIELTRYDGSYDWSIPSILQDNPDTIKVYLLKTHLPIILVWLCCVIFSLLLAITVVPMALKKLAGIPIILSLTAFIFLSGTWILLDSKITTIAGGNYALTYFFSYMVFYLLPVPFLFFFQQILEPKSKLPRYLTWLTVGNAGLWMLLHFLDLVPIRNTSTSVHIIIIVSLAVFIREIFKGKERGKGKRLFCTFWGLLLIFAAALISIAFYYIGILPPANSAVLFAWGLLALILCMLLDTVMIFGRIWKENQYTGLYRQLATEDSMTMLSNRNAYELRLQELMDKPPRELNYIIFDIDGMKHINDTYGHNMGDQVISLVARCIFEVFGDLGDCYRIGGDEFCVIITVPVGISHKLRQFERTLELRNELGLSVKVSHGWHTKKLQEEGPVSPKDITGLKDAADKKMYLNKGDRRREKTWQSN